MLGVERAWSGMRAVQVSPALYLGARADGGVLPVWLLAGVHPPPRWRRQQCSWSPWVSKVVATPPRGTSRVHTRPEAARAAFGSRAWAPSPAPPPNYPTIACDRWHLHARPAIARMELRLQHVTFRAHVDIDFEQKFGLIPGLSDITTDATDSVGHDMAGTAAALATRTNGGRTSTVLVRVTDATRAELESRPIRPKIEPAHLYRSGCAP